MTCGIAFRRDDHHEERQHDARHRDPERRARDGARELGDRVRQVEREHDQHDADQHRRRDVDQAFDVPAHVEPADQAIKEPRQQHDLEHQRQSRGRVEVRLPGPPGDDRGRGGKRQALRGEQVDQREHAPLREHRECQQQQDRREEVDELRVERGRHCSAAEQQVDQHRRAPRAGTRCRGTPVRGRCASSPTASRSAPARIRRSPSFATRIGAAAAIASQLVLPSAMPHGKEQREPDAGVVEELERRRPLDQREVARRVLEHHRLVDHRELEVRGGVVDRDARVLGERDHRERDTGEREARIDRRARGARASRRLSATRSSRR